MNAPSSARLRRGWVVVASLAYAVALGVTLFGVMVNPHVWSAWWLRNAPILFNCQSGWSTAAKALPLGFVLIGFAAAVQSGGKGRALRYAGFALFAMIVAIEAVTWPSPGCPPS